MEWIESSDVESLTETVAAELAGACSEAIEARGRAALALAGGSTPGPIYRRLAEAPLDWRRVTLVPGDERWVAHDHPASNVGALRNAFADTGARFAALTPAAPAGEPDADEAMRTLSGIAQPFDACLLGMGNDGHFASLFPGAEGLQRALDPGSEAPVAVIRPKPLPDEAPFPRVTLTLAPMIASRRLLLVIRGDEKRAALDRALRSGDPRRFPVAALVRHAGAQLTVHWSP